MSDEFSNVRHDDYPALNVGLAVLRSGFREDSRKSVLTPSFPCTGIEYLAHMRGRYPVCMLSIVLTSG